jgi:hypothetical protein
MPITKKSYLVGLCILFASAYSQYLIEDFNPILGIIIIYGVPLLATSLLWGSEIIRKAFSRRFTAVKFDLGFFGAFTILGVLVSTVILLIMVALDPTALNLLDRPNPVLQVESELAWLMAWFSLLVVGPVEEYIFTGFVYGGLLNLFKDRHWLSLAFISSTLFAAIHLYYAVVYEIASIVLFTNLMAFGMAMAATYYLSGGNLLVPAIIHGAYDAMGFVGVATSLDLGILLRGSMILMGLIVAVGLFFQKLLKRKTARALG